ncbi:MAG: TatD family hydrolase [Candidatus Bathyarchaeia archaeon]
MKFVDAHIHLSDVEYSGCLNEIIAEAKSSSVVALVSNSMDLETSIGSLKLAERYPNMVYAALGIHPWNVDSLTEDELKKTVELISKQRKNKALVAIGEIGLDSKYAKIWDKQMMVFDEMLRLAERFDLPVIIHSYGTTSKIIEILPSYSIKRVLLHWFSSPLNALAKVVEKGYYITEGPPTAYSSGIREVVKRVPLSNLLTETDGPVRFFKPPFMGERTTPAFIPVVVRAISEIKHLDVAEVAEQILKNFEEFFQIKLSQ